MKGPHAATMQRDPLVIYTVGHSTRKLPAFLELLHGYGIKQLVDVRTIPRSRKNPQFNAESLPQALRKAHVQYTHVAALGGLRRAARDSVNTGWRNASFRGFADYMRGAEFAKGLERLIVLSSEGPAAIMCAEAVPWRCHRSLIADALIVRGIHVKHILSASQVREHTLTSFAEVKEGRISYPQSPDRSSLVL